MSTDDIADWELVNEEEAWAKPGALVTQAGRRKTVSGDKVTKAGERARLPSLGHPDAPD